MDKKTILFIEDEPVFLNGHMTALEEFGYKVDCRENSYDAIAYLQSGSIPNIIILDIIMPLSHDSVGPDNGMKVGVDLLERIRGELQFSGPIIILTVVANQEEHAKIMRIESKYGREAIIKVKPILPSELISDIENLV
jgi:CheY-like chemotaxis protein